MILFLAQDAATNMGVSSDGNAYNAPSWLFLAFPVVVTQGTPIIAQVM